MKFSKKIFISIFLSTFLIICAISVTILLWISNHQMHTDIHFERELAMLAALKSEDYILRNDRVELFDFCRSLMQVDPYIEYIFIVKRDEILVHTFAEGVPKGLLHLAPIENTSDVDITPVENTQGDIIYHFRIGIGDPMHSMLHFGISGRKMKAALYPLRNLILLAGLLMLMIVPLGMATFLSRFISKPLKALGDSVTRIGKGELNHRLHTSTGDEIEQLGNDINTMADNLERLKDGLEEEIKERIRTEEKLTNQTELLDTILNNVPHNIFWKDKQSVYLGCNKSFGNTAGLENPECIIGKTDYDLPWRPEETCHYRKIDRQVMDTAMPVYDIEETLTQADGHEKTVLTSKVPLKDSDGKVFGILGIYNDITERKKIEETIKQTQKMEAIGTLAGGIAHDFNNILGAIIGYTELAMDNAVPGSLACSNLQQVLKSATRAKDLIRQILTFCRKSQEERKPILLSAIVKEEAKMLRSTLPTTIEIRQNIDENSGMVNADPTQMHQIVMNLCTNAAHAMQENEGVLEISLSPKLIRPQTAKLYHDISPGPFVELKISDTGTGIDSRIIHRIFEPFFTTKDKEKGTGMGLAVVHGIVKEHGGDIMVDSQLGKGTTFTVLLPQAVSECAREEDESSAIPTGSERILFIDDEKILLTVGKKMLNSLGYEVTSVNSSLEAIEIFQQSPDAFDVVITDHTMPHMTGFSLAKRILEIKPSTPIILCTGYSNYLTPEKVEAAGIKALLYKPITRKELARVVRQVLRQRHPNFEFMPK